MQHQVEVNCLRICLSFLYISRFLLRRGIHVKVFSCLFLFAFADKLPAGLRPLADKITKLLLKFPGSRVARFAFLNIYFREYGQVLKPKDWGFGNIDELVRALGEILEVRMNFPKLACSLSSLQTGTFLVTDSLASTEFCHFRVG